MRFHGVEITPFGQQKAVAAISNPPKHAAPEAQEPGAPG